MTTNTTKRVRSLREIREAARLTKTGIAYKCKLTEGSVLKWERGGGIGLQNAKLASAAYGLSLSDFYDAWLASSKSAVKADQ